MNIDTLITSQEIDYNQIQNSLKEVMKILEYRREADLHIMR